MGCDIHTVVQVKKDNKWITVAKRISDDRSYYFFAIFIGRIRDGQGKLPPQIGEPRGLPEDLKKLEWETKTDWAFDPPHFEVDGFWMGDHSFSWYLLSELKRFFEANKPWEHDNLESCIEELKNIGSQENVSDENIRFVFGFDN